MLNFYLNNLDLLERFILYFKDKAASIIERCKKSRIKVTESMYLSEDLRRSMGKLFLAEKNVAFELKKLNSTKLYLRSNLDNVELSRREWACLHQLFQGKRAAEIAQALFISRRTVEKHLDNIKMKFNCSSLTELIIHLVKYNSHLV